MTLRTEPPDKIAEQRMHADQAEHPTGLQAQPMQNDAHTSRSVAPSHLWIGGLALLMIFVIGMPVALMRYGQTSNVAPLATPIKEVVVVPAASVPTTMVTPTPSCVSGQTQLTLIEALEQKSNWQQAQAAAETALDIPSLCEADRRAFTQKAVANGLNVLYYTAVDGQDRSGQQQAVDTYLALRQRAYQTHVAFPSSLQVATQAYQISQFRLAITAIEMAYTARDFDPQIDRAVTHLYVSALYNIGVYETKAPPGSDPFTEGLAYLAASHRLAVQEQTGQGDAATLLTHLIGPDETTWPLPYRSPLLTF